MKFTNSTIVLKIKKFTVFCLKANLDLEITNQLGVSSPNFFFAVVNLDPIIWEKRRVDGES